MEYIIGVIVSLFVQWLKTHFGTDSYKTLGAVLLVSFVAAAAYTLLVATPFWPVIMQVLVTAGAFYAFVLQRFEK